MDFELGVEGEQRLRGLLNRIGEALGSEERRASFALYAMGLLTEGERKSVEPIAARCCGDPQEVDRLHQRLLHFLSDSPWSDEEVRGIAARYAVRAMEGREPIETWIVDDTGFIKQGTHSVGVQRQYTGSIGKVTNCQIGVSLSLTTRTEHVPVDFALYLPKSWAEDVKRRAEARIPPAVEFKTKPELALELIRQAVKNDLPRGVVLADSAYGNSSLFREEIRSLGLRYAVGVQETTKVWTVDALRRGQESMRVLELAKKVGREGFRATEWRQGTRGILWSKFAMRRVVVSHDDGTPPLKREELWLLMEWPDNESAPTKYFLASLPKNTSRKQLVRLVKERYRTERMYEDMKGELGLDHFEGRRFPGWHHHVSVALCCYAFVVSERVRHFPPSARGARHSGSNPIAA